MAGPLPLTASPDLEGRIPALENDGNVYIPSVLDGDEVSELRRRMQGLEPIAESFDRVRTAENGGFFEKSIDIAGLDPNRGTSC